MSREAIFGAALFVLGGLISSKADEPARDRGEYLARAGDCGGGFERGIERAAEETDLLAGEDGSGALEECCER